jgi:hypothetical protein
MNSEIAKVLRKQLTAVSDHNRGLLTLAEPGFRCMEERVGQIWMPGSLQPTVVQGKPGLWLSRWRGWQR